MGFLFLGIVVVCMGYIAWTMYQGKNKLESDIFGGGTGPDTEAPDTGNESESDTVKQKTHQEKAK